MQESMDFRRKPARQGDVFVFGPFTSEEVASLQLTTVPREKHDPARVVLAYGEVTGHAHAIADPHGEATLYDFATEDLSDEPTQGPKVKHLALVKKTDQVLNLRAPATLLHEEHKKIRFNPGFYIVRRQREYSPSEIQRVAD